ncbi:hypothetical protein Nepgr_010462 [Nepenthes gracilis]|uniref:Uncharacterized protein n=1 Tax=Nepenthes gracilis TaxID=150966 RepID=A0AAD3XL41_NEPGR|nr:hypothetical protein Nepgr_010462 [Nepenthes gracilis]
MMMLWEANSITRKLSDTSKEGKPGKTSTRSKNMRKEQGFEEEDTIPGHVEGRKSGKIKEHEEGAGITEEDTIPGAPEKEEEKVDVESEEEARLTEIGFWVGERVFGTIVAPARKEDGGKRSRRQLIQISREREEHLSLDGNLPSYKSLPSYCPFQRNPVKVHWSNKLLTHLYNIPSQLANVGARAWTLDSLGLRCVAQTLLQDPSPVLDYYTMTIPFQTSLSASNPSLPLDPEAADEHEAAANERERRRSIGNSDLLEPSSALKMTLAVKADEESFTNPLDNSFSRHGDASELNPPPSFAIIRHADDQPNSSPSYAICPNHSIDVVSPDKYTPLYWFSQLGSYVLMSGMDGLPGIHRMDSSGWFGFCQFELSPKDALDLNGKPRQVEAADLLADGGSRPASLTVEVPARTPSTWSSIV